MAAASKIAMRRAGRVVLALRWTAGNEHIGVNACRRGIAPDRGHPRTRGWRKLWCRLAGEALLVGPCFESRCAR